MPALRLLGRKWLAATDDLVFPSILELLFRFIWLILVGLGGKVFYPVTWECQSEGWQGGTFVRLYSYGSLTLQIALMLLLAVLAQQSARGTITDINARKMVPPLFLVKVLLVLPEIALNVMGTIWMFSGAIQCYVDDWSSRIVIRCIVVTNWVQLGLTVFGLSMLCLGLDIEFRWAFCCLKKDEHGKDAFQQVAALFSALFKTADLVPSDVVAGCVLIGVRQQMEARKKRSIQESNGEESLYTTDINKLFSETPSWMNLENALHYLKYSIAAYGWRFVIYRNWCTGICKLAKHMTCCCCRPNNTLVTDDNCCMCNFTGFKYMSMLPADDIIYASFINRVFEVPFCVIADHEHRSIVVAMRGSMSLRDAFTDLTADSEKFEVEGLPEGTAAHKGMSISADKMVKRLRPVLEHAAQQYPNYDLILTGHSLGAGMSVLVALKLRPRFPYLKVFAFSPPGGLVSREVARLTESFVMSVGIGDDLVIRASLHSAEKLRTKILQTINANKLPKYRIILKCLGYALFGVPSQNLESEQLEAQVLDTIDAANQIEMSTQINAPLIHGLSTVSVEAPLVSGEVFTRRSVRLFMPGRILHIVPRKSMDNKNKARSSEPTYEMRWACAEDFLELQVMPRMLLDHLPENVHHAMCTALEELHCYRPTYTV